MLQIFFSVTGAVISAQWTVENTDANYMGMRTGDFAKQDLGYLIMTMTGSWILIFCNFVPISLLVTLEMVKFFQGMFMDCDVDMFDADQDFNCRAQSSNINEELGQVEYIFSDKTGTLTCNIMEFNKFSTSTAAFCVVDEENKIKVGGVDDPLDFNTNPHGLIFKTKSELKEASGNYRHADFQGICDVLLHLSICHTVVIDKIKGVYNAASPDEQALVEGAKTEGYEFMGRETDNVIVVKDV